MSSRRLRGTSRQQLNHSRNILNKSRAISDFLYDYESSRSKVITSRQKKFIAHLEMAIKENNLEIPNFPYCPYSCREYAAKYIDLLLKTLEDANVDGYHAKTEEENREEIEEYKNKPKIEDAKNKSKREAANFYNNYVINNNIVAKKPLVKRKAVVTNG